MASFEVNFERGTLTPVAPHVLPEEGRGLLFLLPVSDAGPHAYSIGTEQDGLPVIRGQGGNITSEMVREIEDLLT